MKKDFIMPLDEIEVNDGELLMVLGGNTDSILGNTGCNCDCDCSCGNGNNGCNCNCNCKCGTPPPQKVVECGKV